MGSSQNLTTVPTVTQSADNVSVLPEIGPTVNDSFEEKLLCIVNGTVVHCKRASKVKDVQNRETFPEKLLALEKDESDPGVEGHFMLCVRNVVNHSSSNETLGDVSYTNLTCTTVSPSGPNNVSKNITRVRRDYDYGREEIIHEIFFGRNISTSCSVPRGLENVEIRCKKTPESIVCKSFCNYGYTFDESIERIHKCIYSENVWSAPFEDCTPFVDCSVRLVAPGTLTCAGNTRQKSLSCIVGCEMNEVFDAVQQQTHFCNNEGIWDPPMPFCVEPRGAILFARISDAVEHSDTDYP